VSLPTAFGIDYWASDYWAYAYWTPIDFWAIFALPGRDTSRLTCLPLVLTLIACTLGPFQQLASSDDESQRVNHGDLSLQRVTDGLQVLYDFRTLDTGVVRDLSGIFHACTGANGRLKTGQILDLGSEGIDVYNTMLAAFHVTKRLGPADREFRQVDAIRA